MPPKRKAVSIPIDEDEVSVVVSEDEAQNKRFKTTDGRQVLHYLVFKEGGSNKFYEIAIKGTSVLSRYGRISSNGVTSVKDFDTLEQATHFIQQIHDEKLHKGYREVSIPSSFSTDKDNSTIKARVISHSNKSKTAQQSSSSTTPVLPASEKQKKQVIYLEDNCKFYELKVDGLNVEIITGTKTTQSFASDHDLQAFLSNAVGSKLDEGFQLIDNLTRTQSTTSTIAVKHESTNNSDDDDDITVMEENNDETRDEEENTAPQFTAYEDDNSSPRSPPSSPVITVQSTPTTNNNHSITYYLECKEGSSNKYYELVVNGSAVTIRYARIGASGNPTTKSFASFDDAKKFALKTVKEKEKKGYTLQQQQQSSSSNNANTNARSTNTTAITTSNAPAIILSMNEDIPEGYDVNEELEQGRVVYIQGSGKTPYKVKKFNGGYSCTCPGWIFQIKNKGIQASSCKHLRFLRGDDAEEARCEESAGVHVASSSSSSSAGGKNASIMKKVSLAQQWKPGNGVNPHGYLMSEKLDGMRAYWTQGQLWTRNGNKIHAPTWFVAGLPDTEDLDGELFLGRKEFDACMSIARRTDASEDWKQLKYVIFDCPTAPGGIKERLKRAQELISPTTTPYAVVHPHEVCQGELHLLDELKRVELLGGEGLMLRNVTARHRGGRNTDLLKVKSFFDDEGLVVDYEEGKGKYQGMIGSMICKMKDGTIFKVGSGLSDEQRTKAAIPKKGTVITFKYFELTKDGVPRFPTFMRIRPDVDASIFPQ